MEHGSAGCRCHSAGQGSTTGTGHPVSQPDGKHQVVPKEAHWGNGEAELVSSIVVVFTARIVLLVYSHLDVHSFPFVYVVCCLFSEMF